MKAAVRSAAFPKGIMEVPQGDARVQRGSCHLKEKEREKKVMPLTFDPVEPVPFFLPYGLLTRSVVPVFTRLFC